MTTTSFSRWSRRAGRGVGLLALIYVGIALVLTLCENWLVFRRTTAQQHWVEAPSADIEDVHLSCADGTPIHGWWLPCPDSDQTVLYFHGNAGNLSHRGGSILKIRDHLHAAVLIVDYPGYGKSQGVPTEATCYQTAHAAYDWLVDTQKVEPGDIVIFGASLGGGVAVELASERDHRALVLVKTFTSLPDTASYLYPWLPVHWLMRNRFDSLSRIRHCSRPIFVGHGDADRIVPYPLGQRLFDAANEPKQFYTMHGDDHNDRLPEPFFKSLRGFLSETAAVR
jgi:uncharacterized protein